MAACALAALWTYPKVEKTYSYWDKGGWIPFRTTLQREFITDAGFGTYPNIRVGDDEIGPKVRIGDIAIPYKADFTPCSVQKQIALKWSTQFLQSALILLLASGLLWVFRVRSTPHRNGN
jgi:hypothetical protein